MNAVDLIRSQLEMSYAITMPLLEDLKDSPLVAPTTAGGNHALWILGHLTYAEAHLIGEWMRGGENVLAHWGEQFAGGTQPVEDLAAYPAWEEITERLAQLRASTMEFIATLSDADLDTKSPKCPEQFASFFGTYALCLSNTALHWMMHRGQLADARRVLGRQPLMS